MPPPVAPPRRMLFDEPSLPGKSGGGVDQCLHAYDQFSSKSAGRQKAGGKGVKQPYKNPNE